MIKYNKHKYKNPWYTYKSNEKLSGGYNYLAFLVDNVIIKHDDRMDLVISLTIFEVL